MRQTKVGILLTNLGILDASISEVVKRYPCQSSSDPRAVDTSPVLWQSLLRGVIPSLRAPRVAKPYQLIWMGDGSPLTIYSKAQQWALTEYLPNTPVALGTSYGSPLFESVVDELLVSGVEYMVALPSYLQYSHSTVTAVWGGLARILARKRGTSSVSFIRDYAGNSSYIDALARSARDSFAQHGGPDLLLLSYHGIPQCYIDENNDYPQRCRDTTRELVSALGLLPEEIMMTFQSCFNHES